jgi:magnesium transporter
MDEERIADIVEEMDPGAAADLLGELSDERSEAILEEMDPEERHEVEELLEFHEDSAAGRMTTEYVSVLLRFHGRRGGAGSARIRRRCGDGHRNLSPRRRRILRGAVPLSRMIVALPGSHLKVLAEPRVLLLPGDMHQSDVAELFDKYNLRSLPVVDAQGRLIGVVHADEVISYLMEKI